MNSSYIDILFTQYSLTVVYTEQYRMHDMEFTCITLDWIGVVMCFKMVMLVSLSPIMIALRTVIIDCHDPQ